MPHSLTGLGLEMAKTILIVEDDLTNMRMLSDLLQAQGYKVLEAVDGKGTLQISRQHHLDLILMDIQLPEVSGIDHIKTLKADDTLKNIPVVAVTAFAMKADEKKIRAAGCDDYIPKPVDIPLLLETVAKFLS